MQMSFLQQPARDVFASVDFHSRRGLPVIAHIATTFKAKAGSARRLYRLLRALRDYGYGLILIVGRDFEPDAEWDLEGIHVHQIRSLVKYINPADDLKAFLSLRELLRRLRPHAVHTHLAKAGILGRWAAHLNHTPFILHTIHGPTFPRTLPLLKRLPYLLLERMTGRITDFFVFVGSELRDEYIRSGVCRRNNSVVIRTGRPDEEIDAVLKTRTEALLALRRSILRNGDDVLVVNVGRVVPSKQQDHAIKVVREMRQKGVMAHLALVGEALLDQEKVHMKSLTELACRLGMDNHVTFTGHREDALKIMAASDAVLHTSLYEGLPNILVECALTAKPVVTYAVSGASEVVGNGATGFILDQGDIPAAADRLCFLAKHPSLSGLMGKRARRFLSEEYRESAMIQSKLQFYERIFFPMIGKKADMNPKAVANAER